MPGFVQQSRCKGSSLCVKMIKNHEFKFLWLWILIGYVFFPSNLTGAVSVQLIFFLMIGFLYAPLKIFKSEQLPLVAPILFLGLTFFSLAYDISRVIERDLIELIKPILALTYLLIGLRLGSIDRFNSTVLPLFVLSAFFGFLEIAIPDFVHYFRLFYVRDDGLYIGKPINFWFTTYFAAFFYLIAGFGRILSVDSRSSNATSLFVFLSLFLILFTQSRSGFLSGVILLLSWSLFCGRKNFLIFSGAACIFVAVIFAYVDFDDILNSLPYLVYGIENYIIGFSDAINEANSLGARADQLSWALTNNDLILFGSGVGKGYFEYLESLPALYYYRYGLLGLILYFWMWFILPLLKFNSKNFALIYSMFFLSMIILSLSSVMTDQFRFIPLSYLFLGSLIGFSKNELDKTMLQIPPKSNST